MKLTIMKKRETVQPPKQVIVQDYREYTEDEILRGLVQFADMAGMSDDNLGHWLGVARRWVKEQDQK